MAKSSVLDEAIGATPARSNPKGLRLDRILSELTDCDDFDRLLDMLNEPVDRWGHRQMAGIVRHLCDHYGVQVDSEVTDSDVSAWRNRQASR